MPRPDTRCINPSPFGDRCGSCDGCRDYDDERHALETIAREDAIDERENNANDDAEDEEQRLQQEYDA